MLTLISTFIFIIFYSNKKYEKDYLKDYPYDEK